MKHNLVLPRIYPSVLSADFSRLSEEIASVEHSGADALHWDVMDGHFVDNITFGDCLMSSCRKCSSLRFDAHLMVDNPKKHIPLFVNAGADSIIVHAEACTHLHKDLSFIKSFGKLAGVALNPSTPIDHIKYCADLLDIVLIMSVNPGSSGQTFINSQLEKICNVKQLLSSSNCKAEICIDGGITSETIGKCYSNGARGFVSGAFIFKNENYSSAIGLLKSSCQR